MFNWRDYYEEVSIAEMSWECGDTPEEIEDQIDYIMSGYDDMKFISFIRAKDEYYDVLSRDGFDDLSLMAYADGKEFLAFWIGEDIHDVTNHVMKELSVEGCGSIACKPEIGVPVVSATEDDGFDIWKYYDAFEPEDAAEAFGMTDVEFEQDFQNVQKKNQEFIFDGYLIVKPKYRAYFSKYDVLGLFATFRNYVFPCTVDVEGNIEDVTEELNEIVENYGI